MKMGICFLLLGLHVCVLSATIKAQPAVLLTQANQIDEVKSLGSKTKQQELKTTAVKKVKAKAKKKVADALGDPDWLKYFKILPPWSPPAPFISVQPTMSFQYEGVRLNDRALQVYTNYKYGAQASTLFPLIPGNPGFFIGPQIGYQRSIHSSEITFWKDNTFYDHYLGKIRLITLFYFVWWELHGGMGLINLENRTDLNYFYELGNHWGIKETRYLSTHLVWIHQRFYDHIKKEHVLTQTINQLDLFERLNLPFLNWHLDAGPGASFLYDVKSDALYKTYYVLAKTYKDFFWGIFAAYRFLYTFYSDLSPSLAIPTPPLSSPMAIETASQPDDSYHSLLTIGKKGLFGFLNVHYFWSYRVTSWSRPEKSVAQTYQGWSAGGSF